MAAAPNDVGNILVFDVEGTDSQERGEECLVSKIPCGDLVRKLRE